MHSNISLGMFVKKSVAENLWLLNYGSVCLINGWNVIAYKYQSILLEYE